MSQQSGTHPSGSSQYALRGLGVGTHDEDQRYPPTKSCYCSFQDNETGVKLGLVLEIPQGQWDNPQAWKDALTNLIGMTHDQMAKYIIDVGDNFSNSISPIKAPDWANAMKTGSVPVGSGLR